MIKMIGIPLAFYEDVPPNTLFAERAAWTWRIKDYLGIAYYWTGEYELSLKYSEAALEYRSMMSPHEIERVEKNVNFAKDNIPDHYWPQSLSEVSE